MSENKKAKFLSASRIKTLESCSWLYWGKYHLHLPDKSNDGALRGTICHLVFEILLNPRHKRHFDNLLNKKNLEASPAIKRLVIKFLVKNNINNEENYSLIDSMIYVGLSHDFFGHKGAVIDKPEQDFRITNKEPSYNIYGFMDKPIKYKEEKILKIVDYKSSKYKFRGEDLESNTQAMMYHLAASKIWPEFKKIIVQFLFLRFPKKPIQELEFSKDEIKGFEKYLEHINKIINNFDNNNAQSNFAADNTKNKWLCEINKWVCPLKNAFDYYVLINKDGSVAKSSFKNDIEPKDGETIEKREYSGCPRFHSQTNAKNNETSPNKEEEDLFDF